MATLTGCCGCYRLLLETKCLGSYPCSRLKRKRVATINHWRQSAPLKNPVYWITLLRATIYCILIDFAYVVSLHNLSRQEKSVNIFKKMFHMSLPRYIYAKKSDLLLLTWLWSSNWLLIGLSQWLRPGSLSCRGCPPRCPLRPSCRRSNFPKKIFISSRLL